jgi:hypothetical protein
MIEKVSANYRNTITAALVAAALLTSVQVNATQSLPGKPRILLDQSDERQGLNCGSADTREEYLRRNETSTDASQAAKNTDKEDDLNIFLGIVKKAGDISWATEYEIILRDVARRGRVPIDVSFGYINEGHPEGSHTDGFLAQVWARRDAGHTRISAGAGPYMVNDRHKGGDNNSVGGMVSADIDYQLGPEFSAGLRLNQTVLFNMVNSTTLLAKLELASTEEGVNDTRNEIAFFSSFDSTGTVIGKYSRELSGNLSNIKIAAVGAAKNGEAEGAAVEVCLKMKFGKQSEIDACAGPYYDKNDSTLAAIAEVGYEHKLKDYPFSVLINHVRTSNLSSGNKRGLDQLGILGLGFRF